MDYSFTTKEEKTSDIIATDFHNFNAAKEIRNTNSSCSDIEF